MQLVDTLLGWIKPRVDVGPSGEMLAGTQLAPVVDPKVKRGPLSIPSYLKLANPGDAILPMIDRRLASTDIETYRAGASSRQVMRDFVAASPDLAASVYVYARTAITPGYTAIARNLDGTFNRDATALVQQVLTRFNVLGDYSDGFSGIGSMQSLAESLVKECCTYGAMALELVLDKTRLPRKLQPVSVFTVVFKSDGENLNPVQRLGGQLIDLDIPTFFYVSLDQDLLEPYSTSPFEPAIQPVQFATEFMNDLRRIVKRAIHPRLDINIVWEKFKESLPSDAIHDADKLRNFMNTFIADVQNQINGLKPEDAMVHFDSVEFAYLNNGNSSTNKEYETLSKIIDAKLATGAKAMPSMLGHGSGSQNVASTEAMLFVKNATGIQNKLNEIFSRALTLAVRLFGQDVYVDFKYDPIDLRPAAELEAFQAMRQSRILEQLSLGMLGDEEASIMLTGALPSPSMPPLSGTMFFSPAPAAAGGSPASTTGAASARPGKGSALNQNLKPATPAAPKGG